MINLSTNYLGLDLRNPIIIGSSGLTSSVLKIQQLENAGAGAVIIKSLFEEQIRMDTSVMLSYADYPEAQDYLSNYARNDAVDLYLELIKEAKKTVNIPIIASINCISSSEWISFASAIQGAGADAIELNVFYVPQQLHFEGKKIEQLYFNIIDSIKKTLTIPISVKVSPHFTNIPYLVNSLYARGAKGVVLFNRFYAPDIDIESMSFTTSNVLSSPDDIRHSLRWVGIVSALVKEIDICASTGVHDGKAVVKQILAGAKAVQVCSTLYINGPEYLTQIIEELKNWMRKFNFKNINEFRGRMNYKNISDPAVFERVQFMKYFSNME
jgi:dihydroorotate dehydrogenase (fumarate)